MTPSHRALRILIVSDEVNPHGLSDGDLTQPGELSAAFIDSASGLLLDSAPSAVLEVPTNSIELATAELQRLSSDPLRYDLLVYFAHRIPNNGNNASARQEAFVSAVEQFLVDGGSVVAFHHGLYLLSGKESIQSVLGATATGAVPYDELNGQNVINVAPEHFITCFGMSYPGSVLYEDLARGVPSASYPMFNNTPDERYPFFELNGDAGSIEMLFASDYNANGTQHVLGFIHQRPEWTGSVIAYQPGEYQPNALDLSGPNFQILSNMLLFGSKRVPSDGILLSVNRGVVASSVELDWQSCEGELELYRSTVPGNVTDPANLIATTPLGSFSDDPGPGQLFFYRVVRP